VIRNGGQPPPPRIQIRIEALLIERICCFLEKIIPGQMAQVSEDICAFVALELKETRLCSCIISVYLVFRYERNLSKERKYYAMPICVGSSTVEIRVFPEHKFRALLLRHPVRRTLE
jgi:hypothetical protein